jgi:hypothetical protein
MSGNRQYAFPRKRGKVGKHAPPAASHVDNTPYGYSLEVVQDKSGKVVNSWFVRDNPPKSGPLEQPNGFSLRVTELFSDCSPETRRLDWAINHSDAEFDIDESGCYIVAYITSGADYTGGVAGRFLARGKTHRDCIDAFLRGEAKCID